MRTLNYLDIPWEMKVLWHWVIALDAWEYCDPQPLSELLKSGEPIPKEFQNAVSEIILGTRKQNKKGASKSRIPNGERMKIAWHISLVLGLIDGLKYTAIYPEGTGANGIAAMKGKEPIEIMRELEAEQQSVIRNSAEQLNVSTETIENLLRSMREKIKKWPIV